MTFGHVMHRLKIELSGSTENVSILARSVGDGTADLLTGEMIATGSDMQWITPAKSSDGSLEVVIFPQSAEPYRSGEGLLKITSGGKVSYYMTPAQLESGAPLETFEPGKQTSVRLQLKSNTEQEWANRKVWVDGIREPEEGAWLQLFPETYSTYYLPWKPEYGWYDCDKLNPTANASGVPDGMMCWAAGASNLLHWWIARNIDYVERYDYKGPDYTYPLDKPQESDIFQCFIDAFVDEAGYGDAGLNWFIHGVKPSAPAMDKPENPGGYFKDVFPDGVRLGARISGLSKTRFNETIKDALRNRKGIGFSKGAVYSSHIMTIWGAEFDEEGYVSHIYIADNNDRYDYDASLNIGCFRNEIVYVTLPEGSTQTHYKTGYLGNPDASIPINSLFTVELGQEYWEQYYNNKR